MWKILKNLLPSKSTSTSDLDLNPDLFNDFFANIGTNLTRNFAPISLSSPFVVNPNDNPNNATFNLIEVNSNDVLHKILKLPNQNGLDQLEMNSSLLKLAAPLIAPSLTHIMNLSLCLGIVPSDWKCARVTPIYKGVGDKSEPNNYRPISVVPIVAKVFEKVVKSQLVSYLTVHSLIHPSQSAYLQYHSTQTALHHLVDHCLSNMNNSKINLACTLDLSKGFDTLNHTILLHKLQNYGITGHSLSWFKSYLSDRSQIVCIGNKLSQLVNISMGVPQGTCLGPILFLLYVNNLSDYITSSLTAMYADDTTFVSSGTSEIQLQQSMNSTLEIASHWFTENRLIVNARKLNSILIGTHPRTENISNNFSVFINDNAIIRTSSLKLLGVFIDQNLNFSQHISFLVKKLSPKVGLLHRLRNILDTDTLITVYQTTIQSHIDYCLSIWGNCPKVYINQIQRLQNRSVRAVLGNFDYSVSSTNLIQKLGWMNINQRYIYFTCIMVFKCLHNMAPQYLSSKMNYIKDLQPYNTRNTNSMNLLVPHPNTEIFKQSFAYSGPALWNKLPQCLKNINNLTTFKHQLKTYILQGDSIC